MKSAAKSTEFDAAALARALFDELALARGAHVVVAYSGGRDSHAMLHAMCALRRAGAIRLSALHFDHGMAPQSAAWAARSRRVCRRWEVPFNTTRETVNPARGESLEALARRHRYRWFAAMVTADQVLATAHHADDQAETVLLHLLRGGGVRALGGIPPRRALGGATGAEVVRPLLGVRRAALADYARRHRLRWCEDPSNQQQAIDRNYLRLKVLPSLEERWPGAVSALGRSAQRCSAAAAWMEQAVDTQLGHYQAAAMRGVLCDTPPLALAALRPLGAARIPEVLRLWLRTHGRRPPSAAQLTTLTRQLLAGRGGALHFHGAALRCYRDHLYLTPEVGGGHPALAWDLTARALDQVCPGLRVELQRGVRGGMDPARMRGRPVRLVWRRGGERMTLPRRRHTSALKHLFQQHHIPPWERDALPLLQVGEDIAWAHGIGAAAACCYSADERGVGLRFTVAPR